jgi:[NiFe] hydrogenase diaphorase moiety large subunit
VIGTSRGLLYLRGEYRYARYPTGNGAPRCENLLAWNLPESETPDRMHGRGSCLWRVALIESLEGKRGVPRNRPPYPVTNGYLQQPTIVNNVETLCAAALIAVRGGDWYRGLGTLQSSGTKLLSVAGDVARPGIYE